MNGGYGNDGHLPFTGGPDVLVVLVAGVVVLFAGIALWRSSRA